MQAARTCFNTTWYWFISEYRYPALLCMCSQTVLLQRYSLVLHITTSWPSWNFTVKHLTNLLKHLQHKKNVLIQQSAKKNCDKLKSSKMRKVHGKTFVTSPDRARGISYRLVTQTVFPHLFLAVHAETSEVSWTACRLGHINTQHTRLSYGMSSQFLSCPIFPVTRSRRLSNKRLKS